MSERHNGFVIVRLRHLLLTPNERNIPTSVNIMNKRVFSVPSTPYMGAGVHVGAYNSCVAAHPFSRGVLQPQFLECPVLD